MIRNFRARHLTSVLLFIFIIFTPKLRTLTVFVVLVTGDYKIGGFILNVRFDRELSENCLISDTNVKNLRLIGRHNKLPKVGVSEDGSPFYRHSINRQKSLQAGNGIVKLGCVSIWSFEVLTGETTQSASPTGSRGVDRLIFNKISDEPSVTILRAVRIAP